MTYLQDKNIILQASKQASKQYYAFDIVKFVAAICVVAIHTHPLILIEEEGTPFYYAYDFIVNHAVPIFFIISGFLLFSKINNLESIYDKIKELDKYILRILKLYLIWHIIYLPISIYGAICIQGERSFIKIFLRYAINLFCKGEQWYSWPLWYLLSTIYAVILIRWFISHGWSDKKIYISAGIIYLGSFLLSFLVENINNLQGASYLIIRIIRSSFGNGRIFSGIGYLTLGMAFSKIYPKIRNDICIILLLQ